MRAKLHLTDKELMDRSWIALNLEVFDYPYIDYNSKDRPRQGTAADLERLFGNK